MNSALTAIEKLDTPNVSSDDVWNIAKTLLQVGRLDRSIELAYSLVQQDPSQRSKYNQHYLSVLQLGAEFAEEVSDFHRAAYYWEQLLQQQPQMVEAWYGLALAQANLGEISQAQRAIERCLQIDPRHSQSQRLLANLRNSSRN